MHACVRVHDTTALSIWNRIPKIQHNSTPTLYIRELIRFQWWRFAIVYFNLVPSMIYIYSSQSPVRCEQDVRLSLEFEYAKSIFHLIGFVLQWCCILAGSLGFSFHFELQFQSLHSHPKLTTSYSWFLDDYDWAPWPFGVHFLLKV